MRSHRLLTLFGAKPRSSLLAGLQFAWNLQEDSGTATDLIGGLVLADNNSVLTAAGPGLGIPKARAFVKASSQYLSIDSNADLQIGAGSFTIAGWAQATSRSVIVAKDNGTQAEYFFEIYPVINARAAVYRAGGAYTVNPATTPVSGTWYMFFFGYDAVQGKAFCKLNTDALAYSGAVGGTPNSNNGDFWIGRGSVVGTYSDARIAAVYKWNRLLTPTEMTSFYASGAGILYPF